MECARISYARHLEHEPSRRNSLGYDRLVLDFSYQLGLTIALS